MKPGLTAAVFSRFFCPNSAADFYTPFTSQFAEPSYTCLVDRITNGSARLQHDPKREGIRGFLLYRGGRGFDLPLSVKLDTNRLQLAAQPKEFGGDTVGRLGMCAHTPKRNTNNAHGVTPIHS
jgi:hypothetical protein